MKKVDCGKPNNSNQCIYTLTAFGTLYANSSIDVDRYYLARNFTSDFNCYKKEENRLYALYLPVKLFQNLI